MLCSTKACATATPSGTLCFRLSVRIPSGSNRKRIHERIGAFCLLYRAVGRTVPAPMWPYQYFASLVLRLSIARASHATCGELGR